MVFVIVGLDPTIQKITHSLRIHLSPFPLLIANIL